MTAPPSPFVHQEPPGPTLVQRLFRRPRVDAAAVMLGNILATDSEHGLTSGRLEATLRECHADSPSAASAVAYRVVRRAYEILANRGAVTSADDGLLARVAQALSLPPERVQAARGDAVRGALAQVAGAILSSHRVSPKEESDFAARAAALGAGITLSDFVPADELELYRQMWAADNGELPNILVDIHLQRGEICHATFHAAWAEHRTVTTRVRYDGYVTSVRIMKGVRYRVGSYRPVRETRDVLRTLDEGRVYVTSKRVIFQGAALNKSVTYSSLLSVVPYSDGIELEKASGKPPVLLTSAAEYAAVMISAALGLS